MRFPLSKILTCAVGVVTVLPLVLSAAVLVSFPVVAGESKNLTMFRDVNADGKIDIVTPMGEVFYNVGNNRYRSNEIIFTGDGYRLKEYAFANGTLVPYLGPVSSMDPSPFHFLDQDGDGIPETIIFTNYGDFSMTLYRDDGTGTFTLIKSVDILADPTPEYIAVIDLWELKKKYGEIELL